METSQFSPVPQTTTKPVLLSFYTAIREVLNGNKITRLEWDTTKEYGFLGTDGFLSIHRKDQDHHWLVSDGDMLAEDWIVVKEEN